MKPTPVENLSGAKAVSAGLFHTCALMSNSAVVCWGHNAYGQLGDGSKVAKTTPVNVKSLSGVKAIDCGQHHTCALKDNGSGVCWGHNPYGQLGDGTSKVDKTKPVTIKGLAGATVITAGVRHSCAVRKKSQQTLPSAVCWGYHANIVLGSGSKSNIHPSKVTVKNTAGVKAIAAGNSHTCAVNADSTISCWGYNDNGQLGDGAKGSQGVPAQINSPQAPTIACSDGDACTSGDGCKAGKCVAGGANKKCDDGNPCTKDSCDKAKGCVAPNLADKTACSADGKKWCVAGKCVGK